MAYDNTDVPKQRSFTKLRQLIDVVKKLDPDDYYQDFCLTCAAAHAKFAGIAEKNYFLDVPVGRTYDDLALEFNLRNDNDASHLFSSSSYVRGYLGLYGEDSLRLTPQQWCLAAEKKIAELLAHDAELQRAFV